MAQFGRLGEDHPGQTVNDDQVGVKALVDHLAGHDHDVVQRERTVLGPGRPDAAGIEHAGVQIVKNRGPLGQQVGKDALLLGAAHRPPAGPQHHAVNVEALDETGHFLLHLHAQAVLAHAHDPLAGQRDLANGVFVARADFLGVGDGPDHRKFDIEHLPMLIVGNRRVRTELAAQVKWSQVAL